MMLVHTIRFDYLKTSELFSNDAASVFRRWDVICTSLTKMNNASRSLYSDNSGQVTISYDTGLFYEIGFLLSVPPQNILGTHDHDVWFPNHIGVQSKQPWELVDSVLSGIGNPGGEHAWPARKGHSYNHIETPEKILSKTKPGRHNEIMVVGKPGVSIYPGFPPTAEVGVKLIIYRPKQYGRMNFTNLTKEAKNREAIDKLRNLNPGVMIHKLEPKWHEKLLVQGCLY